MTSTINASTTAGIVTTADTSGVLALQTAGTTAVSISAAQVVTLAQVLPEASGGTGTTVGYYGFKNRIINGAMVIDQRNAGASVAITGSNQYTLDRWQAFNTQASKFSVQQNAGSVTPPSGFSKYYGATSSSAYSVLTGDIFGIVQVIEGFNMADLAWGTANAQAITLSFRVYSSLTGTFGGSITNGALNYSYPFTYSIPTANTWTTISVTIAGDTTGTWVGATNGVAVKIWFSLGSGSSGLNTAGAWVGANSYSATGAVSPITTNSATFYITGVQLEKGSTATSFDYRPFGTELNLCQRYFEKSYNIGTVAGTSTNTNKGSYVTATGNVFWRWTQNYRVSKRIDSTFLIFSTTGASGNVRLNNASDLAVTTEDAGENAAAIFVSRNATVGDFFWWQWTASAEL